MYGKKIEEKSESDEEDAMEGERKERERLDCNAAKSISDSFCTCACCSGGISEPLLPPSGQLW